MIFYIKGWFDNMILVIFLIILLFSNIILLLFISYPALEAVFTNNIPLDGTFQYRNLLDWSVIYLYYFFISSLILFTLYNICNIAYLFIKIKNNQIELLKKYCKIIKLSSVPFWIIYFILHIGLFYSFYKTGNFYYFVSFLPLFISISYYILLTTSSNSVSYLLLLKKNDIINKNSLIKNIFMQLFFIIDIIVIIKLLKKVNNVSNGTGT